MKCLVEQLEALRVTMETKIKTQTRTLRSSVKPEKME